MFCVLKEMVLLSTQKHKFYLLGYKIITNYNFTLNTFADMFFIFLHETYVVVTHWNHHTEIISMSPQHVSNVTSEPVCTKIEIRPTF